MLYDKTSLGSTVTPKSYSSTCCWVNLTEYTAKSCQEINENFLKWISSSWLVKEFVYLKLEKYFIALKIIE